jgi:hypothetical protein
VKGRTRIPLSTISMNSPVSTTPGIIFNFSFSSCYCRFRRSEEELGGLQQTLGFSNSPKSASMIKLPLSVTHGPTLHSFPIRNTGRPPIASNFFVRGTTLMGMICNFKYYMTRKVDEGRIFVPQWEYLSSTSLPVVLTPCDFRRR